MAEKKDEVCLLYDETKEKYETYTYRINGGGSYFIIETGKIILTFVDGKFFKAEFPFVGMYSRNGWRILAAIEQKISEIEARGK